MIDVNENMHAWSHFVLFLMLFMIALAVLRMGGPTGLAANNQTISADGVTDLKPFLTAVGLLMGLFIAIAFAISASFDGHRSQQVIKAQPNQEESAISINTINRELQRIRRRLGRFQ